jgi:hypothetical protein
MAAVPHHEIAKLFVQTFYNDLCTNPVGLKVLYGLDSTFSFAVDTAEGTIYNGQDEISKAYCAFNFTSPKFALTTMDSTLVGSSVLVNVIGAFSIGDALPKIFVQCFVLTPSEDTYYVKSDMIRMLDSEHILGEEVVNTTYVVEEPTPVEQQISLEVDAEIAQDQDVSPEIDLEVSREDSPVQSTTPVAAVHTSSWATKLGAAPSVGSAANQSTIGVKGLDAKTTQANLRVVFGNIGNIKRISHNVAKGTAFLDMEDASSVTKVMNDLSSYNVIDGVTVEIFATATRAPQTAARGGRGSVPRPAGVRRGGMVSYTPRA